MEHKHHTTRSTLLRPEDLRWIATQGENISVSLKKVAREATRKGIQPEATPLKEYHRTTKDAWGACVIGLGFEPRTDSLEGYCSIQLSYPTNPWSGALSIYEA